MRIKAHIGLLILAALLTACVQPLDIKQEGPVLGLVVEFPESMGTKAGVGGLSASAGENVIRDLRIWVFNHDNAAHPLVAYKQIDATDFPVGENIRRYALVVTKSFAENPPHVDVFVLANASAINRGDMGFNSSYAEVSEAAIQGDVFGIENPVHIVTENGLPMSGCLIDQPVAGSDPQLMVPTVTLSRMVSRLRFIFCKTPSTSENIKITGITINGEMIAAREYLFLTNGGSSNVDGYVSDSFPFFVSESGTDIAENNMPEKLVYGRQDPSVYEKLIQNALAAGELTALPNRSSEFTYLRESEKKLRGTIFYKVWKAEDNLWLSKEQPFEMADAGDFARNHTWTVYGYFLHGSNLQLNLNVLPWNKPEEQRIDFSGGSVVVSQKFQLFNSSQAAVVQPSEDAAFTKEVYIRSGMTLKTTLTLETPKDGTLYVNAHGDVSAFKLRSFVGDNVEPTETFGAIKIDPGKTIRIEISRSDSKSDTEWKSIYFTFDVELSNERRVGGDSEIVDDKFRFWVQ